MQKIKEFKWEDILSVGYNTIDLHHKKLLLIINEFAYALNLPQAEYKLKIGKTLKNLSAYTDYHFSEEEKIMKKFKYSGLQQHSQMHAEFIKKLNENTIFIASGNIEKGIEFYNFLGTWLVEHIAGADHEWSNFIHANYPEAEI